MSVGTYPKLRSLRAVEVHTLHLIPHPMQYSLLTYLEHMEGRSPPSTPDTLLGAESPYPREEPCPPEKTIRPQESKTQPLHYRKRKKIKIKNADEQERDGADGFSSQCLFIS